MRGEYLQSFFDEMEKIAEEKKKSDTRVTQAAGTFLGTQVAPLAVLPANLAIMRTKSIGESGVRLRPKKLMKAMGVPQESVWIENIKEPGMSHMLDSGNPELNRIIKAPVRRSS